MRNSAKKKKKRRSSPTAAPIHPVTAYALAVVGGEIVTGRLVRLACHRHLRDLKHGHKRGLRFDEDSADHIIDFYPRFLRHREGRFAGKPFVLSPHQKFIAGSLFGWLKADGYRRFRTAYIEEGKGDGKTPFAAGAEIYGLTCDGEIGAEIYCAAVTRDQAGIAFQDCKHMAEGSLLAESLTIGVNNIAYGAMHSFIRPVSSEARSLDGKRVHMAILDELHEHPTPLVVNKMQAGWKGRMQPMNFEITNSGYDRISICWEHHEYGRQILELAFDDDEFFAYICQLDPCQKCLAEGKTQPSDECPKCDHWWEEKNWIKANPNLGTTITVDYLRTEVRQARRMPTKADTVKRLNFCIWTESAVQWMPLDEWDSCNLPVIYDALRGRECYAGLDLADTTDTTALVLVFPPLAEPKDDWMISEGERTKVNPIYMLKGEDGIWRVDPKYVYHVLPFIFVPEIMKKRTEQQRERFRAWIRQKLMYATPGNQIDYQYVLDTIRRSRNDFKVKALAFDRWGSSKITTDLQDDLNFTIDPKESERTNKPLLVQFGQGWASMSAPMKEVMDLTLKRKIAHGGHPAMRWMVSNTIADQDPAGNIKPNKGKSNDKIDGTVAMIMATELALKKIGAGDNIYEARARAGDGPIVRSV